ncbi:MAG: hypothetical protein U5K28_11340 [Halobacteriales archaeon]|nr:hypothetical protein [Halobacteriales archaeon]
MESDSPLAIDRVVVHTDDIVTAVEANVRRDAGAVLRITPPFSGRMRARLHLDGQEADYGDPQPVHIDPAQLVAELPAFPTPDDTEERLREAGDYSVEQHREAHTEAVAGWRRELATSIVESTTIDTVEGSHEVTVVTLG